MVHYNECETMTYSNHWREASVVSMYAKCLIDRCLLIDSMRQYVEKSFQNKFWCFKLWQVSDTCQCFE